MTFFYDMNKKLADVLKGSEVLKEGTESTKTQVQEKWDTETKVSPAEKGKYAGKTKAELLKQYDTLKKSGPHKQGTAEFGKMRELAFAIRAKSGWGKVAEADMEEGNEFSGELAKAKAAGAKEFKVDGKTYPVNEAKVKPDFLDLDDDGDRKESMKKAAKDKTYRHKGTYGTSYDPSDEEKKELAKKDTGVKKGRGRPKKGADSDTGEVKKWDFSAFGMGGKDVKLPKHAGKVTKHKMVGEDYDKDEYDEEGEMAKSQARTIADAAMELHRMVTDNENLPEWVQKKINLAQEYIDAARDYLKSNRPDAEEVDVEVIGEKAVSRAQQQAAGIAYAAKKGEIPKSKLKGASKEMAKMPEKELEKFASTKRKGLPKHVDEESTDTRDDRAEKAGRKVAKDIEYDERVKDKIHGKKRGAEDTKAERAGKRVTKDIEHDEKVDETTTAGSVAVAAVAPKSKKGLTYGKGIYDSLNREVEGMIAESMSINMSMTSGEDGNPSKSLTVTATDDDAIQLASLLKMAGLEGQSQSCDYTEVDEAYGDTDATKNEPDYPTDEEYSSDPFQYSGGLNKPKETGQTTIPVIASQTDRQHAYEGEEMLDIKRLAGVSEGDYTQRAMDLNPELGKAPTLADRLRASAKKIANVVAPDDETLLRDLQKKVGVPQTGKKPGDLAEQLKQQLQNFKS